MASTRSNGKRNDLVTQIRRSGGLVGTAEAAEILQVERPRIGRWLKRGIIPEPIEELAASPVWLRTQIEGVREERERRRRRTKKDPAPAPA